MTHSCRLARLNHTIFNVFSVPPHLNAFESINAPARMRAALSFSLVLLIILTITQGKKRLLIIELSHMTV